jgi:hypothetical protein
MRRIRRCAEFTRNKRKMRRLYRRFEGRKGPGMNFFD